MKSKNPHVKLDKRLFKLGKSIKILDTLTWPLETGERFLADWKRGSLSLPVVSYEPLDFSDEKDELQSIAKACDADDRIGLFLRSTALSYLTALEMLENRGTARFTELSIDLYGTPRKLQLGGQTTTVEAAEHFVAFSQKYSEACEATEEDVCILPGYVADQLRKALDSVLGEHNVEVVVDPKLVSKAAAGAERIRVRGSTCFSHLDVKQLIEHEALVHTLTLTNGRKQKRLRCLGDGSPRTTKTQEGLALFAELITNAMDVSRLRRISARVKAIDLALAGADFVELFRYFLDIGQSPTESYYSAMRVFRGGDVNGYVAFTKDTVYLEGFLKVHAFFREAIEAGNYLYPHYLFAGRLTTEDVVLFEDLFLDGTISLPRHEPEWVKNRSSLMAFLVYSSFLRELQPSSQTAPA